MPRFQGKTQASRIIKLYIFSLRRRARSAACSSLPATIALLVAACTFVPPPSQSDLDDETKEWTEVEAQLPPPPKISDLVGFYVSPVTDFRFSLDRRSISIGTDGVVRYTLVGVSKQGAKNISYEGMRCGTRERKLYAVGRNDGTWAESRKKNWERVTEADANRQYAELMKEILCPEKITPRNVQEILDRIARSPRADW